jgi:hypothetical protein
MLSKFSDLVTERLKANRRTTQSSIDIIETTATIRDECK